MRWNQQQNLDGKFKTNILFAFLDTQCNIFKAVLGYYCDNELEKSTMQCTTYPYIVNIILGKATILYQSGLWIAIFKLNIRTRSTDLSVQCVAMQ